MTPRTSPSLAGLNIEHLQTEQHRTKKGAPQLFTTHCHVCGTAMPDISALREALKQLEAELGVFCKLDVSQLTRRSSNKAVA